MDRLIKWFFHFVVLVWNLRKYQKAWFKEHRQSSLIWAKHYESEVDRELFKLLVFEGGQPIGLDIPDEVRPTTSPTSSETEHANLFVEDSNEEKS